MKILMNKVAITIGIILVVTLLPPASHAYTPPNEVYIAVRTDGTAGTGTENDPFDGSTQAKLDALLPSIAPNTSIHFGAGTFLTNGSTQMKEGWSINGLGKTLTTIKLANNVLVSGVADAFVIQHRDFVSFLNYFEIRDLTLDCNFANQPSAVANSTGQTLNALNIAARNCRVTNVRAVGAWSGIGESFPFSILHNGSDSGINGDRIEVQGCDAVNFTGYMTCISVVDQAGGYASGFIRNCVITGNSKGVGFGSGQWRNFEVSGNYTDGLSYPVVIDTFSYYNVSIFGNKFTHTRGIVFNGAGTYENIKVYDNLITSGSLYDSLLVTDGANVTAEIYHNTILQNNPSVGPLRIGINTKGILRDNIIQSTTPNDLSGSVGLEVGDNYDQNGNFVPLGRPGLTIKSTSIPPAPASGVTLWFYEKDKRLHAIDHDGMDHVISWSP